MIGKDSLHEGPPACVLQAVNLPLVLSVDLKTDMVPGPGGNDPPRLSSVMRTVQLGRESITSSLGRKNEVHSARLFF